MLTIEFCLFDDLAYLNARSYNKMHLGISTPPFIKTNWKILNTEEKFDLIEQAFSGCKTDLPNPDNGEAAREFSESVLKTLGFSSWRKYYQSGWHCTIENDIIERLYYFHPLFYKGNGLSGVKNGKESISADVSHAEFINGLESFLLKMPSIKEELFDKQR